MGLIGEIFADAGLHTDTASFSQYASSLSGAEKGVSGFAAAHSTAFLGVGTAMVGAVAGVATYGVMVAAGYEKTQLQLEGLLGSQQAAGDMMKYLSDFAATTPFEFPELAEASAKLIGAGLDAKEYMTVIGDVAAGTQKSVDQVTEAFLDAQNGEWERLKELQIQHLTVSEANYQKYGATVDQIGKDILVSYDGNGKQLVEIFDKSSKEATNAALKNISVEKFSGAMDKVAGSMAGKWSTIKDNINNTLVDIVGFEVGEEKATGLYLVLQKLADVAITVTGAFSGISEPMQKVITVAAAGTLAVGGLAIGIGLIGAASSLATPGMTALWVSINAAIWPATLIVAGIALLAAGLIYLEEKTGLVSAVWAEFADEFTIAADGFSTVFDQLSTGWTNISDFIGEKIAEIKAYLTDIIPESAIAAVNDFVTWSSGLLGDTSDTHAKAETIRARKSNEAQSEEKEKKISDIFDPKSERNIKLTVTADTSQADQSIQTLDGHLNELPPDAAKATTALTGAGNVQASGTIAGILGIQQGEQNATASAEPLRAALTANGNVNFAGTNAGIVSVDTAGKKTTFTVDQLQGYLTKAGNVPFTGSIGGMGGLTYGAVNAGASANKLTDSLTRGGQVSYGGTISQISEVNSKGVTTSLTAGQLQTYLRQAGDVSFSGTQGQLTLVEATGKRTNITTQQATALLKTAGSQSMGGTIGGINGITTAWGKANAAANAYAKSAMADRAIEKTYESGMKGSTSTGQSKGGVSVVGAGQNIRSTNTVINNTYHQPTASDKKAQLAIIGRS